MLKKFLKSNKNDFENYLSIKLKDVLVGRFKLFEDGFLYIYLKNFGNMNMEDFLKDFIDGLQFCLGVFFQFLVNQDLFIVDEDVVGDGVFKVMLQMNRLVNEEGQEFLFDVVLVFNNIIYFLLND